MEVRSKRLMNPRFSMLDVKGELIKINISGKTTFLVKSDQLKLELNHDYIIVWLNQHDIDKVVVVINGDKYEWSQILSFSDLVTFINQLTIPDYWKNDYINFLLYTFIRLSVCILTGNKMPNVGEENRETLLSYMEKQSMITNLLHNLLEVSQISHSPYVVNQRAVNLLTLGLNPKEKYEKVKIKEIGKPLLKLTHPDTEFGETELFKKVNEAVRYFK